METKWTGYKYVTTKYYLTKGYQIFYSEGSGNNTTVTVAVGYGAVVVSVSVPLGKKGGKSEGVAKTAKKKPIGSWQKGRVVSKKYNKVTMSPASKAAGSISEFRW